MLVIAFFLIRVDSGTLGRLYWGGPVWKAPFFDRFWVPTMVPKILQANLIFYVVFATLASQTVLAEKLKVFKKARRDASSPVQTKLPGEWKECYFNGKMRTAPQRDTEQNGAKHFTVARRAIVTCFRRVMIVFAGISVARENSKS